MTDINTNKNACDEHQDQPTGQRGCVNCVVNTNKDNVQDDKDLHYRLLKLQDKSGKYVISSLGANDGYALIALEEFIATEKHKALETFADELLKRGANMTVLSKKGNVVKWWPDGFNDVIRETYFEFKSGGSHE